MSQTDVDEMILDVADSHPDYTIDQFIADFKSTFDRNPTIAEKRNFQKAVKNIKTKPTPKVINGYTFGDILGKGSFGEVHKATKCGTEYAIKQIDESQLSGDVEQSFADSISARLNSKFIVRYFDKFRGPDGELYIVMELCQKGDLRSVIDHLREINAILQTPRVAKILIQLLLALDVLHRNKLIHRDLKPENIFSDKLDNVKVGDFGCSKELDTTSMKAHTVIGTPLYESPQVIRGEEYDSSADMWALGVVLYELCTLQRPFQHANRHKLHELIFAGKFAPLPVGRYPDEIGYIIQRLLHLDPNSRPTARALLQLPFIQRYAGELGLLVHFPFSTNSSTGVVPSASTKSVNSETIAWQFLNNGVKNVKNTGRGLVWESYGVSTFLFDTEMTKGLYWITIDVIDYPYGDIQFGLAAKTLLHALATKDLCSQSSGTCCIDCDSIHCGGKERVCGELFNHSCCVTLSLEFDTNNHILYFFVNGVQTPHCVVNVPPSVHFAVSGSEHGTTVAVKSFTKLKMSKIKGSVECSKYDWK